MPRGKEPKKGAASGETLRGGANILRSGDTRMGKPGQGNAWSSECGMGNVECGIAGIKTIPHSALRIPHLEGKRVN